MSTLVAPCPIDRESREAAERVLVALRDLHDTDLWVYLALVQLAGSEWREPPANTRDAVKQIRKRTHELKLTAVEKSLEQVTQAQAQAAAAVAATEWTQLGDRLLELHPAKFDEALKGMRVVVEVNEILASEPLSGLGPKWSRATQGRA